MQPVSYTIDSLGDTILAQVLLFADNQDAATVSRIFRSATQKAMLQVKRELSNPCAVIKRGKEDAHTPIEELFTHIWLRFEQVNYPRAITLCGNIRDACLAEQNRELREQRLESLLSCIQRCEEAIQEQNRIAPPAQHQQEASDVSDSDEEYEEGEETIPPFLADIIAPESLACRIKWLESVGSFANKCDPQPSVANFLGFLRLLQLQAFAADTEDYGPIEEQSFSAQHFLKSESHLVRFFNENTEIETKSAYEEMIKLFDATREKKSLWAQSLLLIQFLGFEENSWTTCLLRCFYVIHGLWHEITSFVCDLFRSCFRSR